MTSALGIGVNVGIFSVVNGVLFRDLPAPDAEELVAIQQRVEGGEGYARSGSDTFSASEYRVYRDRAQTLFGVLAHGESRQTTLGGDAPQEISGTNVSCNYFAVLRQPPALGRVLTESDCEPGAQPVIVIGHRLWTTTFAADSEIVGRTVQLNRQVFTVVGVASEDAYGGSAYDVAYFAPISTEPLLRPSESRYTKDKHLWLHLIGRRKADVGVERVRAEVKVIAAQIDQLEPGRSTTVTIERATAITLPFFFRGAATGAAVVLMAAFALILLIACANVANLLLARGTARSREIGIRLSLGASRIVAICPLLAESLLISIAGGVLGSVLALWSFQALVGLALPAVLPAGTPALVFDFSPDFRVLLLATAMTLGAGLLFGLAPALRVSRSGLSLAIKQDAATAGGARHDGRLRGTLVGLQVALCMALMIAVGLLVRGLYATYATDLRFDYRGVTSVSVVLDGGYPRSELASLQRRLIEGIEALPGVDGLASALLEPLATDESFTVGLRLPGQSESQSVQTRLNVVTPNYFSLLGIAIIAGRNFTEAEARDAGGAAATNPVIVSEATARNLWPGGDSVGRTLQLEDRLLSVVGVAGDAQVSVIGEIDPYYIYEPSSRQQVLLVRSRGDFDATASAIRATLRAVDPTLAVRVRPLAENLAWWRGLSRTVTALGSGLGLLALALAAVGVYGVVAYAVTRRYREIGIRMALGAAAPSVLGMMLRQSMRPVIIGSVVGIGVASALSSVLSSMLFGISPADPIGLGGGALFVIGVALAAAVLAARRATGVDPMAVLRYE